MPAESMGMSMTLAANLLNHIVKAKGEQRPSGNPWEPGANLVVQLYAAPCDQEAQGRGEQDMPATSQSRDQQRLRFIPLLYPRREHEGQPVGGDGRMKKGDGKPGNGDGG